MTLSWIESRFRSSPALELKRIDELQPAQRDALAELQRDPDFYGVLVPRLAGAATLKSVGQQTASLLTRLAMPSSLPAALFADDAWRNDILDLVLDGILEIECEGRFVFGSEALPLLVADVPRPMEAPAHVPALSLEALRHAEALSTRDAAEMTGALYSYNRLPRTRVWASRFPDRQAVLDHLGDHPLLERHWIRSQANSGWISWQSRSPRPGEQTAVTWKLYVSPRPEHIREAFSALVRVLAAIEGAQMKIGPDAAGLLRPDKLVAYFPYKEDLDLAASELGTELRGCPAHGVPFTAALDEQGLLSWGADPPDSARALSWLDRESWRLWVAKTLAAALAIAKQAPAPALPPWQFALERARRHGVDVRTWAPSASLWSSS
ncbi:MAG: hypothetical protein ABI779_00160 [Acidobacteriota bacterium]